MYKIMLMLVERILRRVRRKIRHLQQSGSGGKPGVVIAIVILVSDEVHNHMRQIQLDILDRYGASSGLRTSPHITLKQGFCGSKIDQFERYFDELVTDVEPIEICVKGIDSFENNILYLDVEPNPRLETLRRRVLHDISNKFGVGPSPFEGNQYHFHATLAYGLSKDDIVSSRQRLANANIEFRFALDSLGLLISTGNGWATYKRARLSRSAPEPLR